MLYYLLFWTLLGFIIHFYIIFGTNLLTQGPVQIAVFLPTSVFRSTGGLPELPSVERRCRPSGGAPQAQTELD